MTFKVFYKSRLTPGSPLVRLNLHRSASLGGPGWCQARRPLATILAGQVRSLHVVCDATVTARDDDPRRGMPTTTTPHHSTPHYTASRPADTAPETPHSSTAEPESLTLRQEHNNDAFVRRRVVRRAAQASLTLIWVTEQTAHGSFARGN